MKHIVILILVLSVLATCKEPLAPLVTKIIERKTQVPPDTKPDTANPPKPTPPDVAPKPAEPEPVVAPKPAEPKPVVAPKPTEPEPELTNAAQAEWDNMCKNPEKAFMIEFCKSPKQKINWYKYTWPSILSQKINEEVRRKKSEAEAELKAEAEAKREVKRLAEEEVERQRKAKAEAKEEAKRQAEAKRKAEAKAKRLAEDRRITFLSTQMQESNKKIRKIRKEINRLSAKRVGRYGYALVSTFPHKTYSERFTAHEDKIGRKRRELRSAIAQKIRINEDLNQVKCKTGRSEYVHSC